MAGKIFVDAFVLRFPRTGIVNCAYNTIKRLHENADLDVTILLQDLGFSDQSLGDFAKSVPYRLVSDTDFERQQRRLLGDLWQVPGLLLPLPGTTTRVTDPCDVYHCTDIYYYPSAKAHRNVITMYDITTTLYPHTHEPLNIQKEREKIAALKDFDTIVSISDSTKIDLVNYFGIDENKIVTAHLGVDDIYEAPTFVDRAELARSLGIPRDRRYVLSVSTIEPRKNIIGALEAFRLFAETSPADDDVVLVLAGHVGWKNEVLAEYLARYPYRDRVFFTGYVPLDLMPSLYRYSEAFIYLSFYEGFGLPILEAMKSGAPVICSDRSSMPEVIGDCGMLVDPESPEQACDAIKRLIGNPDKARDYRNRALKRSQRFTWQAHVDALMKVYGFDHPAPRHEAGPASAMSGRPAEESETEIARYGALIETERRRNAEQRADELEHIKIMTVRPEFTILIEGQEGAGLDATLQSCASQLYPPARIARKPGEVRASANASFLLILNAGDILDERALYECAAAINADPNVDLIYFDEDVQAPGGRRHKPFFKPDWSPDYLEAVNYIGTAACYNLANAQDLLKAAKSQYDFTLRFTERATGIQHIREILLHCPESRDAPKTDAVLKGEQDALSGRLARTGRESKVTMIRPGFGAYRVEPRLKSNPLVSIVIPTAARTVPIDGKKRDLIAACTKSIVERSTYRDFEFVIVENGDLDPDRLAGLGNMPVRYVTYLDTQVNISRKMNLGAACAAGEFLLLLNDDTEVISPDWIERMLFHFEKPHVGLVGGKLLYPDRTVQHVGAILTRGHPDHVSRGTERDAEGYFFSGCAVRNYLAMTGAMTMIRSSVYRDLGGYEERMPLTFNDIDLSMKVWKAGLTVLLDPDVELFHFEGKSATNSYNFDDRDFFFSRWGGVPNDPFYNEERFSLSPANYELCENMRFI